MLINKYLPFIKKKFETYHAFGEATLTDIYGAEALEQSLHYSANTFASTLFLNGNEKFTTSILPQMAQISSINGIIAEDFNGDGYLDLLTAGNLYQVEVEIIRNDASIGLFMLGDGKGNFVPVSVGASGFVAAGDIKHLEKIKLSGGDMGILVVRNDGPVSLFKWNMETKMELSSLL
jgi:hypothetical protein